MLDFIYDSLDTVKKLKFPTIKQIAWLTWAIFWLVILAGIYFIIADTIFSEWYKAFYAAMTEQEDVIDDEDAAINLDDVVVADDAESVEVEDSNAGNIEAVALDENLEAVENEAE